MSPGSCCEGVCVDSAAGIGRKLSRVGYLQHAVAMTLGLSAGH
ncbi:Unknown protein sequence [Pseudomonas syringae pv. cilantro]|uniref:Uncharacterized protein n=1 Tax=Pseudomonas syringae pv. cilantro TaxID=81035 RepID=A0A0N0XC64_PSESX|nr:Unknown protein sequence [Pseudomonas syringae pv. cilantro]